MSSTTIENTETAQWPAEVEMILSALEMGEHACTDRRSAQRRPFRVRADLRLFSEPAHEQARVLYTRDACARGIGFITAHRLPLGYGGKLVLELPDGKVLQLDCTLHRCRQTAAGWYEGALYFNREQPMFAVKKTAPQSEPAD